GGFVRLELGCHGRVDELAVALAAEELIVHRHQAFGAAHHREALPSATATGRRHARRIEGEVVDLHQIESSVTVVVEEGRARAPTRTQEVAAGRVEEALAAAIEEQL